MGFFFFLNRKNINKYHHQSTTKIQYIDSKSFLTEKYVKTCKQKEEIFVVGVGIKFNNI